MTVHAGPPKAARACRSNSRTAGPGGVWRQARPRTSRSWTSSMSSGCSPRTRRASTRTGSPRPSRARRGPAPRGGRCLEGDCRMDPASRAGPVEHCPDAGALRQAHHRVPADVVERDPARRAQRVAVRDRGHQPLAHDRMCAQPGRRVAVGVADQAQVGGAAAQPLEQLVGGVLQQADPDARMRPVEPGQRVEQRGHRSNALRVRPLAGQTPTVRDWRLSPARCPPLTTARRTPRPPVRAATVEHPPGLVTLRHCSRRGAQGWPVGGIDGVRAALLPVCRQFLP